MYQNEFEKLLNSDKFPNNFLLYGDLFFMDLYEQNLKEKFKDYETLKLYFDEFDFDVARNHLIQQSLFGGKNLLIIKTDKNIPKLKELIEVNSSNNLLLFFYGNKPNTKPFGKNFVRFFEPKYFEKAKIINQLQLPNRIKEYLIKHLNMNNFFNEIEKLKSLDDITLKDVENLIIQDTEITYDEFYDELFLKNSGNILTKAKNLIENGNDTTEIIISLNRYLKNLYLYYLHIKVTGNANMQSFFGFRPPKNIEEKRNKIIFSMNEEKFQTIFEFLTDIEIKLKESGDKETLFFYTILNLQTLI